MSKQTKHTNKKNESENFHRCFREWICNIGTILIYITFCIVLFVVIKDFSSPYSSDSENIGKLIWDSFFSVVSGVIAVIDILAALFLKKFKKHASKIRIVTLSLLTYCIAIFNNIAIQYPLSVSITVLINFIALVVCIGFLICLDTPKKENNNDVINANPKEVLNKQLFNALASTDNKKIIAIQMYEIIALSTHNAGVENIEFYVKSGVEFIRDGNDINSISSVTYVLERGIVDQFQTIMHIYQEYINKGQEAKKKQLLELINPHIEELRNKLKDIDIQKRDVTKEDCCIARVLIIYLAIKRILNPDPKSQVSHADYIGEVMLHDGDLDLSPETENKLFTLVRTGILGAVLLGENARHVFHYRKDGLKHGRKYCATCVGSFNNAEEETSVNQEMDVCLFTVEANENAAIPGYVIPSIAKRESLISSILNTFKVEGGDNEL